VKWHQVFPDWLQPAYARNPWKPVIPGYVPARHVLAHVHPEHSFPVSVLVWQMMGSFEDLPVFNSGNHVYKLIQVFLGDLYKQGAGALSLQPALGMPGNTANGVAGG